MNIYSLFPFIATIAYIPLLVSTLSSRPWQRRNTLFIIFLISAIIWSLTDYFARSNFFLEHGLLLFRAVLVAFSLMAVQFHCFTSSFFAPGQRRWLPFAYISLGIIIILVGLGYIPKDIEIIGERHYPDYGIGIIAVVVPLMTLAIRNLYVFVKRLKVLDNPMLYNQIFTLILGICVVTAFSIVAIIPSISVYPISHFGNLINAFILSYAVIKHQLMDIKIVLRRGIAWVTLVVIGGGSYWILLYILHAVLNFDLSLTATVAATGVAIAIATFVYRLRGSLFFLISRGIQGQIYNYRQELTYFANTIHNVFTLKAQGGNLLTLITKAVGCKRVCLLFPETNSSDFTTQLAEPADKGNPLYRLTLREDHPVVEYLNREQKPLTRESLSILPEFRSLWEQEKEAIYRYEIELFMPLISREKLIAILALSRRQHGRYSLEDFNLLEDVTNIVAVSIEKEYLREQLRSREEELSLLNRSIAIITSKLDIQEIFDSFIAELKKIIQVHWASILLVEGKEARVIALSAKAGPTFKVGDRLPLKGTFTEWVVNHQKPLIDPDLQQRTTVTIGKYHLKQGVRHVACLPLIAEGKVFGSLVITSLKPNAISQRHLKVLDHLSSQISIAVQNSQLYAKVEEQARVDQVTGLFNRRSLDEMITSEIGRHSRYGGIFSLIILDLDSFKLFNDNYGHPAGDKLLKQVGNVLKKTIRTADQAFRYGGDEFAILLPQTGIEAAQQVAERVRKQVSQKVNAGDVQLTASLGLSTWPVDGISADEIIIKADAALYYAKHNGGNQCHCASEKTLPEDITPSSAIHEDSSGALSSIYALAATVDARNPYTSHRSKKVIEYSLALASALNLGSLEKNRLECCAMLHDIGKIGISNEILNKHGKLTDEEWDVVKTHPQLGAAIVSQSHQLAPCIDGILYHHEEYDGSGYPKGLRGVAIPLEARILAIADAFVELTSNRPDAAALTPDHALEEIRLGAGTKFDPQLVELFYSVIKSNIPVPQKGRR